MTIIIIIIFNKRIIKQKIILYIDIMKLKSKALLIKLFIISFIKYEYFKIKIC